ncbi:recombinase family protein [Rugosimonospora africana]|uniref:Resolvase/invertase-type recombinase catalytic domain-containing protein n=1 Tax=Rugosimonospora africana TaxID=556532 RepID=A0A8J3R3Y3_9ACTN|nr:recombinase family protein [Rugosimonospora africana]GIH21263.1 hypothetical protein Raf01_94350 [Rugosimonospora africana]
MLGYLRTAADLQSDDVAVLHRQVATFAEHEGYTLGEVFVEVEASGSSAFAALINAALEQHAAAVVVPTLEHFGRLPGVRAAVQGLLESRTGVRVLVLTGEAASG